MLIATVRCFLASAAVLALSAADAQLAVSANDGKLPRSGETGFIAAPDSVTVIDLGKFPPRLLGTVAAPTSLIGPPTSVAVARDESFAIVSATQKADPAALGKFVPGSTVSVIDLEHPARPAVIQTIDAGAGALGVFLNRAGTLALVVGNSDGMVSVFTVADKKLSAAGKLQLDGTLGPADIALSPDGKIALVTQRRGNAVWRLKLDGTTLSDTGIAIATGVNPYGVVFSRDGRFAYNVNLLGKPLPDGETPAPGAVRIGTVTAIEITTNTVASTVEVGVGPEHLILSPNGRYMAVVVVNGSAANPTSPTYRAFGLLKVYRVAGAALTSVAEAQTGAWTQGAVWSNDGRTILVQSAADRRIDVYRFSGKALTRDAAAAITLDARPAAIATARSR